jgi:hypothetical protein
MNPLFIYVDSCHPTIAPFEFPQPYILPHLDQSVQDFASSYQPLPSAHLMTTSEGNTPPRSLHLALVDGPVTIHYSSPCLAVGQLDVMRGMIEGLRNEMQFMRNKVQDLDLRVNEWEEFGMPLAMIPIRTMLDGYLAKQGYRANGTGRRAFLEAYGDSLAATLSVEGDDLRSLCL